MPKLMHAVHDERIDDTQTLSKQFEEFGDLDIAVK